MKKPTHLILDSYSHPGISLFWKRHGLSIMEHLVPNDFSFTTNDIPLEKLIEKQIWSGWKKIILIGTQSSIRRGFNVIMGTSPECRSTLSIGFWPISIRILINYINTSSLNLRPILQVFKAGQTLFVDVPKVQFLTSKKETKFFWNNFFINSTHNSSRTTIFVDEQNFDIKGKFRSQIVFHDEILNSLTMHPNKLTRTPLLNVYLKQNIDKSYNQKIFKLNKLFKNSDLNIGKEFLLSTGRQVEISGNWANLSIGLPEINDTVDYAKFKVEKKSLSMIIPAKPIHSNEKVKNIIPTLRPSNVIPNN